MAFSDEDVRANRDFFIAKLRAEKQLHDVVRKVKEGKGDFLLIDARPREAFLQGHIPGACSLPIDAIDRLAPSLPRDRELVVYCWSHH